MQEIFISITLVFSSLFVNVLHNGASEFIETGYIFSLYLYNFTRYVLKIHIFGSKEINTKSRFKCKMQIPKDMVYLSYFQE